MARSSISCSEVLVCSAIWARLRCVAELIRIVEGIQICIRSRMRNCQRTRKRLTASGRYSVVSRLVVAEGGTIQPLPQAACQAHPRFHRPSRRAEQKKSESCRPAVTSPRSRPVLFVYDLDLLVNHLTGKTIDRHVHPVMLLPLHDEFVGLGNASRVRCVAPALCNHVNQ